MNLSVRESVNESVKKISRGDMAAFDELEKCSYQIVYCFIKSRCYDSNAVEDLVVQTFLTVIKKSVKLISFKNCMSWILTIAANHVKNFNRSLRRKTDNEVSMESFYCDTNSVYENSYDNMYDLVNFNMTLDKLSAKDYEMLLLNIKGYTYKEIGRGLKVSESTIKRRMKTLETVLEEVKT